MDTVQLKQKLSDWASKARSESLRVVRTTHWRRYRPWLIFVPITPLVALILLYSWTVLTFKQPQDLILGGQTVEILDRNGGLLFTFGQEEGSGKVVSLDEVSPDLVNATVATEDAGFWTNHGFSMRGLARAAYENLAFWKTGGLLEGSGGSSITQQLAKNLYIKPADRSKRSPVRKLKEALIAFELNRRYSKQQILAWYLSDVYYGHGAYGVESASHRYFDKAPKDLTLAEAATLAGLPRAPSLYDPLLAPDQASNREKQVLTLMARHGMLTDAQANDAAASPVKITEGKDPNAQAAEDLLAPHFSVYVHDLLPTLLDKSSLNGPLRVTTTLDPGLQARAESIVKSQLDKFEKQYGATNGALVAMDPATGEILAMVGSHDFTRTDIAGQVNNAISLNEPGSTLKPVTYLTAILKGWSPSTMIVDEPIKVPDGETSYTLGNADGKYRGSVPVRTALGSSLNVPAVKALDYATLPAVYAQAKRMGISTLKSIDNYGPAFTLGGVDVNLLDMTYVYSVFAGQGEQAGAISTLDSSAGSRPLDPVAVLKVESSGGHVVWKAKERKERIVTPAATYLVTNILSDDSARVSMFGANSALNLPGRPAAVKTGSSDETRDLWAIGYTPQIVAGVWVGNDDNKPMNGATSSAVAAPIWSAFMTAALQAKPVVNFTVPDGIEFGKVCATTGQAPASSCPKVVDEVFLAGRLPAGVKSQAASSLTPTQAPKPVATATPLPTQAPPAFAPPPMITPFALPTAPPPPPITQVPQQKPGNGPRQRQQQTFATPAPTFPLPTPPRGIRQY